MLNLTSSIEAIERLMKEGSDASHTYAALECRLAIERICYERLQVAHDYISQNDLIKWQPHAIVNILLQEVDKYAATTFEISISTTTIPDDLEPTKEDYEAMDYVSLETQIGFNPSRPGKLWNALSKVALHVPVPTNKTDPILQYCNGQKAEAKVAEALAEIKRISEGNLVSTSMLNDGGVVTFTCECGTKITRQAGLLKEGQIVNCFNPDCQENYNFERQESEPRFVRRTFAVSCKKCGTTQNIPKNMLETLKKDEHILLDCEGEGCGNRVFVQWRLMQAQAKIEK